MLTGMTAGEFDLLYAEVEKRCPRIRDDTLSKRERTRAAGAGRPAAPDLRDAVLLLCLLCHRTCVTQDVAARVFGIGQASALP